MFDDVAVPDELAGVACMASDTAGNAANASFDVHVKGADEQLDDLTAALDGVGPGSSLGDKLTTAHAALDAGDVGDACGSLAAFAQAISAQ